MSKKFLVCIDSDGCAFDTMEVKHKECFCPAYINYFGLQPVSKYARDAWDFANLYSCYRGIHRILALLKALEVLEDRAEVQERKFTPPALKELRAYVDAGKPLSHTGLEDYLKEHPDAQEIRTTLEWSINVNDRVGELVHGVPPFPYVRECLEKLHEQADIVIVSATQQLALEREWGENGLLPLITAVKGQESGSKKEIIASLKDQYAPDHILMIGDAPGDLNAAKANNALFYPICPDHEAESWAKFGECMDAFFAGTYAGEKEEANIAHFNTLLPEQPYWVK
jgi:phosphoglycolate phosphatase-like HAD superfamily hydrolase